MTFADIVVKFPRFDTHPPGEVTVTGGDLVNLVRMRHLRARDFQGSEAEQVWFLLEGLAPTRWATWRRGPTPTPTRWRSRWGTLYFAEHLLRECRLRLVYAAPASGTQLRDYRVEVGEPAQAAG